MFERTLDDGGPFWGAARRAAAVGATAKFLIQTCVDINMRRLVVLSARLLRASRLTLLHLFYYRLRSEFISHIRTRPE